MYYQKNLEVLELNSFNNVLDDILPYSLKLLGLEKLIISLHSLYSDCVDLIPITLKTLKIKFFWLNAETFSYQEISMCRDKLPEIIDGIKKTYMLIDD